MIILASFGHAPRCAAALLVCPVAYSTGQRATAKAGSALLLDSDRFYNIVERQLIDIDDQRKKREDLQEGNKVRNTGTN